jgi:hypothetical protein
MSKNADTGVGASGTRSEVLVKEVRVHLRLAERLNADGDKPGALLEEKKANDIIDNLVMSCAGTIQRYAKFYFGGDHRKEACEDAEMQMTLKAVKAIKDLSNGNDAYERRFNLCLKRDCIEAAKSVLRENGYIGHQSASEHGYKLDSLDRRISGSPDDAGQTPVGNLIADPRAEGSLNSVLTKMGLDQELSQFDGAHQLVTRLRMGGETWSTIAAECGVCAKTAMSYFEEVCPVLLKRIVRVEEP